MDTSIIVTVLEACMALEVCAVREEALQVRGHMAVPPTAMFLGGEVRPVMMARTTPTRPIAAKVSAQKLVNEAFT